MDWIEQVQRDLGAPVVDFALANWLLLLAVAALGAWWLFGGGLGGRSAATGEVVFTDTDADSDDGDGGGD